MKKEIAIIGGGAAGMMAAIEASKSKQFQIVIYEGNNKLGKKVQMTGNGKCNFSNKIMDKDCYLNKHNAFAFDIISRFDEKDMSNFLLNEGMLIKEKKGYLYPYTEQAITVVELLKQLIQKNNIKVCYDTKIKEVFFDKNKQLFLLKGEEKTFQAERVIIATGGMAAPKTGSDGKGIEMAKKLGHTIIPVVPALVQLKTKENYMKRLAGLRLDAEITLYINKKEVKKERGELQIRDFGLSGIVIFQVSRFASYAYLEKKDVTIEVDFLPEYQKEAIRCMLEKVKSNNPNRRILDLFLGILPLKLIMECLKLEHIKEDTLSKEISISQLEKVIDRLKKWTFVVTSPNTFEQAQVSAGGVSLEEIKETCESVKIKHLYFAGEVLDVDGICGGYNLQWAFSSGVVAGQNASIL